MNDQLWRSAFPSALYCIPFLKSEQVSPDHVVVLKYWTEEEFTKKETSFTWYTTTVDNMVVDMEKDPGNLSEFTANNTIHMQRHEKNEGVIREVLGFIQEKIASKGEKVMVVCSTGKHLSSVVIGCYRKVYDNWAISSVVEEMRRYQGVGSAQLVLEQWVEMFEL